MQNSYKKIWNFDMHCYSSKIHGFCLFYKNSYQPKVGNCPYIYWAIYLNSIMDPRLEIIHNPVRYFSQCWVAGGLKTRPSWSKEFSLGKNFPIIPSAIGTWLGECQKPLRKTSNLLGTNSFFLLSRNCWYKCTVKEPSRWLGRGHFFVEGYWCRCESCGHWLWSGTDGIRNSYKGLNLPPFSGVYGEGGFVTILANIQYIFWTCKLILSKKT